MQSAYLVLFEVPVEVTALADLLHGAEAVVVDFEDVQQPNNPRMLQTLGDLILPYLHTNHPCL